MIRAGWLLQSDGSWVRTVNVKLQEAVIPIERRALSPGVYCSRAIVLAPLGEGRFHESLFAGSRQA